MTPTPDRSPSPSPRLSDLRRDASFQAVFAGFLAMFIGLSGTLALLVAASATMNLGAAQTTSWLTSVCVAIGVSGALLSWRYRAPVVTAFSTPGLALLAQASRGIPYAEVIGALLVTAALVTLLGFTGLFDRLVARVPGPVAAAVLAGILLPFGLGVFRAFPAQPLLVGAMILTYLALRALAPRYAVPAALASGLAVALVTRAVAPVTLGAAAPTLVLTFPEFSVKATLVLALPMTLLALASQHLPGLAVLRASGYGRVPASPLVGWTGLASLLSAGFGAHTTTLAAITAAICAGPEAHPDERRRWVAGVASGVSYLVAAACAGLLAGVFVALPGALVTALAGLALTGSILSSLTAALSDERWRETAVLTVLVTASGVTFLGVGSAFWGFVLGGLAAWLLGRRNVS
ncbi:benzoate/H(+) symporter BenE family transporter [Deinococcus pimensis]|uniref:benzoate/H(+) symporter BenE family transporter n=1 Tax=Deinococcus pimensis TaxID=309888 RepID=UPI000482E784|nr:benzoate/H(+) symporter BenE family transporter [Deinococcus pimensis]